MTNETNPLDAALQRFRVLYPEYVDQPFVKAAFAVGYRMRQEEEDRS